MSDVKAVRYLLSHNTALTAVVPATAIVGGVLPQGVGLPAIGVARVSNKRTHTIAASGAEWCVARVQVTVHAETYPQQKQVQALVRAALKRQRGSINGVDVDSIASDIEGPDFTDAEASICAGSDDFIVRFNE